MVMMMSIDGDGPMMAMISMDHDDVYVDDKNVDIDDDVTQVNSTSSVLTIMSFGSDDIGYYVCSAQNPIGNPMSNPGGFSSQLLHRCDYCKYIIKAVDYYVHIIILYIARVVIDLATAPPVQAPEITMAGRTAADVAQVTFDPDSPGVFTVRYYYANDTSIPDLVCT